MGKKKHLAIFGAILIGVLATLFSHADAAPPVAKPAVCPVVKVEGVPPVADEAARCILASLADHTGVMRFDAATGKTTLFLWPATVPINRTTFLQRDTVRAIYVFRERPASALITKLYLLPPDQKPPASADVWLAYASPDMANTHPLAKFRH